MSDETLRRIADALERLAPSAREVSGSGRASRLSLGWPDACRHRQFCALAARFDRRRRSPKARGQRKQPPPRQRVMPRMMCCCGARAGWGNRHWSNRSLPTLQAEGLPLALVEAPRINWPACPPLFAQLGNTNRRFILFIDDMAFEGDDAGPRRLRSMLEGGSEARPDNVRLIVTSNRRNIVERNAADEEAAVNARDVADDRLALADRFGMKLGFQYPDQAAFLAMVSAYAAAFRAAMGRGRCVGLCPSTRREIGPRRLALCDRAGGQGRARSLKRLFVNPVDFAQLAANGLANRNHRAVRR